MTLLEECKDRLIAVHLHDNDGKSDLHALPFTGTVGWPRLLNLLRLTSYTGSLTLEVSAAGYPDGSTFLREAFIAGADLDRMAQSR
ncbi:MAG: hypothetical protein ACYC7E_09970 [Armatimonadota bacterium]